MGKKNKKKEAAAAEDVENKDVAAENSEEQAPTEKVVKEPTVEEQLADQIEKNLRLAAEFQNYRRRMERELTDARQKSKGNTIEEFLPVFDTFAMAMTFVEQPNANIDVIKPGLLMIQNKFETALDGLGVSSIVTKDKKFDHNFHDAVAQEETEEIEEGMIVSERVVGYMMGERLLRPSKVVVSKKPEPAPVEEEVIETTTEETTEQEG